MNLRRLIVLALSVWMTACQREPAVSEQAVKVPARNWQAYPALVEVDTTEQVYALSDVHGQYEIFARLLAANRLIDAPNENPAMVQWTGGRAILVIAGDVIDKGPKSLPTIDLIRTLERAAARVGGRVVTTMGNHEAEFLLDPENDKATSSGPDENGINNELEQFNIDPASLAKGRDRAGRGAWLAGLPFGVRINDWFFAHGGNTQRLSIAELGRKLQRSVDRHGFGDADITGEKSLLQDQGWYGNPSDTNAGRKEADVLGVKHIGFGHNPSAFYTRGTMEASKNRVLVKLDTAMGIRRDGAIGAAFLLHVNLVGAGTVEVLDAKARATLLW